MRGLLNARNVASYLVARGLIEEGDQVEVQELGGGVSNTVLAVRADDRRAVVKQSLPRLRVPDEWLAKRERAVTEAEMLRLVADLTPGRAPALLDADPEACALVIEHAPDNWTNWKTDLLAGRVDAAVAAEVGRVLGIWHTRTENDQAVARRFADDEAFEQLRVDPFYRTVARRRPELAGHVLGYVDRMLGSKRCLVHGDYSPKNVLCGDSEIWILDYEVAHMGDPAFDLAYMLNHLMLKAIHVPGSSVTLRLAATVFLEAYEDASGSLCDRSYVLGHAGCLMTARVDGKSPAEYLTDPERTAARSVGAELLSTPPGDLDAAWRLIDKR